MSEWKLIITIKCGEFVCNFSSLAECSDEENCSWDLCLEERSLHPLGFPFKITTQLQTDSGTVVLGNPCYVRNQTFKRGTILLHSKPAGKTQSVASKTEPFAGLLCKGNLHVVSNIRLFLLSSIQRETLLPATNGY